MALTTLGPGNRCRVRRLLRRNGGSAAVELFVLRADVIAGVIPYHLVGIKLRWPGFDNVAMFHEDVQFV